MDNLKLKPCPFCGSTDIAIVKQDNPHNAYDGNYPHLYTAACKQCLSRAPQKVYEGYAAEAWNTRTSGWIPCSERMPPTGTRVYVREGDFTAIGFFGKFTQRWIEPISGAHLDNVSHWMPLPEPPEDVE